MSDNWDVDQRCPHSVTVRGDVYRCSWGRGHDGSGRHAFAYHKAEVQLAASKGGGGRFKLTVHWSTNKGDELITEQTGAVDAAIRRLSGT